MSERSVTVSPGVELCYERRGDPGDPLVLLVMGLGLDLCWWRDDFFSALAGRGFSPVRFDNRDVGRSTHFAGPGVSAIGFLRRRANPVYSLAEMADDAAGLIGQLAPAGGAARDPRHGARPAAVGVAAGARRDQRDRGSSR